MEAEEGFKRGFSRLFILARKCLCLQRCRLWMQNHDNQRRNQSHDTDQNPFSATDRCSDLPAPPAIHHRDDKNGSGDYDQAVIPFERSRQKDAAGVLSAECVKDRGDHRADQYDQSSNPDAEREKFQTQCTGQPPSGASTHTGTGASNTTRPPTIVVCTRPFTFQPANGVLRLFDRNLPGSTSHCACRSTIATSASAPTVKVPFFRPKALAGAVLNFSIADSSDRIPSSTSASVRDNAVSRPTIPKGASVNPCCFSCVACGA